MKSGEGNLRVTAQSGFHQPRTYGDAFYRAILGSHSIPFQVTSAGSYNVTVHWDLNYSVNLRALSGGPGITLLANAQESVDFLLTELTKPKTFLGATGETPFFAQISNGTLSAARNDSLNLTVAASLLPGHSYGIWTEIEVGLSTEGYSTTGHNGYVRSSVDMNSGSNGATLTFVTVS